MVRDDEARRWINLLHSSPGFVFAEGDGTPELQSPSIIRANTGLYWVAGTTMLPGGQDLDSVFVVDSDAGGELARVYWLIGLSWFESTDPSALDELRLTRADVFPFDWSLAVPLEDDTFHPPS